MIEAVSVSKQVAGSRPSWVLRDCSLSVPKGVFAAIVGSSGAGKSSLLNCLGGFDRPSEGGVRLDGTEIYSLSDDKRARYVRERVSFIFQDYNLLDFLTVEENVLFIDRLLNRKADRAFLRSILESLGLIALARARTHRLSGGERQRVAVARALYARSQVILADEPTGALDAVNTKGLVRTFRSLVESGVTVLIVTHDIEVAAAADLVLYMHSGTVAGMEQSPSELEIQRTLLSLHGGKS